jgi:signal transduction histidine kinase
MKISLARRLLLIATMGAILLLATAGFFLADINRKGVERTFDRRLQVYAKLLIADLATLNDDSEVEIGTQLSEPLFELPQSGWYWQITRLDKINESENILSRSMWDWQISPLSEDKDANSSEGYISGPDNQRLRVIERVIDLAGEGKYRVSVAGNAEEVSESITPFNYALFFAFTLLGLGFIIAAFFQVRYGLKPLEGLTTKLAAIRNGQAEKLEGEFPEEISPLTTEMNALIAHNQEVVNRARTHVGNLAHALKTPLSVIKNESEQENTAYSKKIAEQTTFMQVQVNHHLERAKLAARVQYISTLIEVEPTLLSLIKTMERVYSLKDIVIYRHLEPNILWRGELNDVQEIVGNLLDNACKWAKSEVQVSLKTQGNFFLICIEDDGEGLNDQQREEIGQRGKRLDETKPGSGLGLSIVKDLLALYRGSLTLETSLLGGLSANILLPKQF